MKGNNYNVCSLLQIQGSKECNLRNELTNKISRQRSITQNSQ